MWNSNSVVAWLLAASGIDPAAARLPDRGRAPGWDAGLAVSRAAREVARMTTPPPRLRARGVR
jgi:hypothetical protein